MQFTLMQFLNKGNEMNMQGVVLHAKEFNPMSNKPVNLIDFEVAAVYECEADDDLDFLNQAFEATNSIDYHWSENEGIKTKEGYSWRSTSVGDIVMVGEKIYRVENFGFKVVELID